MSEGAAICVQGKKIHIKRVKNALSKLSTANNCGIFLPLMGSSKRILGCACPLHPPKVGNSSEGALPRSQLHPKINPNNCPLQGPAANPPLALELGRFGDNCPASPRDWNYSWGQHGRGFSLTKYFWEFGKSQGEAPVQGVDAGDAVAAMFPL